MVYKEFYDEVVNILRAKLPMACKLKRSRTVDSWDRPVLVSKFTDNCILWIRYINEERVNYEIKKRTINGGFQWYDSGNASSHVTPGEFAHLIRTKFNNCNENSYSKKDVSENKLDKYKPIQFTEYNMSLSGNMLTNLCNVEFIEALGLAAPDGEHIRPLSGRDDESVWFVVRINGRYVICTDGDEYYYLRSPAKGVSDNLYDYKIDMNKNRIARYPKLCSSDKNFVDAAIKQFVNK